ncbi:MAG: hypothetical protein NVS2B14_09150 [Chamaesiphon sp.]
MIPTTINKPVKTKFVQNSTSNWWVEITTDEPRHVYHFGYFSTLKAANIACIRYIEKIENLGAQVLKIDMKQC